MNAKQTARRQNFTQVIADNKACFRMCTSAVNLCVTGMSSDELRKKFALNAKDSIRSVLTSEQVKLATRIEETVAMSLEDVKENLSTLMIVTEVLNVYFDIKAELDLKKSVK